MPRDINCGPKGLVQPSLDADRVIIFIPYNCPVKDAASNCLNETTTTKPLSLSQGPYLTYLNLKWSECLYLNGFLTQNCRLCSYVSVGAS